MSTSVTLLHPLNVQIAEFLEDEHDLQFKVEFPAPEFCTACGAIGQSIRFSKKLTKYVDLPIRGKRTVLWGMRRRYKCKSCSKVFSPALLDIDEKHRMTKRCHAHIIKQAMTTTNSAVARDLGLDESVVRRVLRDYCAAKAMQGMLAYPGCEQRGSHHHNNTAEGVAAMAYDYADAMLAMRTK